MNPIPVRPDRFCRTSGPRDRFRLIVDAAAAEEFVLLGEGAYRSYEIMRAHNRETAARTLAAALSDDADVLVISRGAAALPAPPRTTADDERRLTILPCDTTPTAPGELGLLLAGLERCPSTTQADLRQRLLTALGADGTALLVDGTVGTEASLDLGACVVSETRHFRSLTMTAADGPGLALPLTGRLTVRGLPIVRTPKAAAREAEQQDLYESLLALAGAGAILEILAGAVTRVLPATADDSRAADALSAIFATDHAYRIVTGLGVGLDLGAQPLPGNHEANTAVGGTVGQVFVVLGDIAGDEFEIILGSPTALIAADGAVFAKQDAESGSAAPRRRLNRVKSASCGCH